MTSIRPFARALAIAAVLGLAPSVLAQETFEAPLPVLVTSSGQALDAFAVQTMLTRAGVENTYDNVATAEDLDGYGTVVIAMGASVKGFGAAGITAETEIGRTRALLDAAGEAGIPVIGIHIGGEERRGGLSEQFVDLVAGAADALIVSTAGNADGRFTDIAEERGVPLVVINQPMQVGTALLENFFTAP